MASPQPCRRPLLCGYYGEHNLGDDALLEALLHQLPKGCDPVVTAFDEQEVAERHRVRTCARRSLAKVRAALEGCDALVLGGGSLLQDSTSFRSLLYYAALIALARVQGKPVLLWAQGLGPLRRRRSRLLVKRLLPLAQRISWRDQASAALARRWGIQGSVGSDPVWSLPTLPWHGQGGPIVLCWRPTPLLQGESWSPLLQALDQLVAESGREVIWLPFHRDQDRSLLPRLEAEGRLPPRLAASSRVLAVASPEAAMAQFASAGLVLPMRLHGLILAALAGAPCSALRYDPKVGAAATAIGCPCLDLEALPSSAGLAASWMRCLDRPVGMERIEPLRTGAQVHREILEQGLMAR